MERSVLTSIFVRFRENLRGIAAGITGSRDEADDVLHDAFCKLWMNHRDIQTETDALRLSYTAVKHTAIDAVRVRKAHPTVSEELVTTMASDPNAVTENENKELCDALLSLSRKVLKDKYYQIFIMHDVENLSYPEIAENLGLTQENVRAYLSRARKTIREVYRNNYEI